MDILCVSNDFPWFSMISIRSQIAGLAFRGPIESFSLFVPFDFSWVSDAMFFDIVFATFYDSL